MGVGEDGMEEDGVVEPRGEFVGEVGEDGGVWAGEGGGDEVPVGEDAL
jgi:hypothetical protein